MFLPRTKRATRKIFCIGHNKTGTTSVGAALRNLGFTLANQQAGELLVEDWACRRFERIVKYCRSADAFQDVPFSLSYTYQLMDYAFPRSRFILTMRDSSEQWYSSLIRYHTKLIGKGRLPKPDDLREFGYIYRGYMWRASQLVYGIDDGTLYDKNLYVQHYERHNRDVMEYFKHRTGDLLVLNLAQPDAMERMCEFVGVPFRNQEMPHLLRSD